jgi:hypothetical protein
VSVLSGSLCAGMRRGWLIVVARSCGPPLPVQSTKTSEMAAFLARGLAIGFRPPRIVEAIARCQRQIQVIVRCFRKKIGVAQNRRRSLFAGVVLTFTLDSVSMTSGLGTEGGAVLARTTP